VLMDAGAGQTVVAVVVWPDASTRRQATRCIDSIIAGGCGGAAAPPRGPRSYEYSIGRFPY
jgi:hypothetical protein